MVVGRNDNIDATHGHRTKKLDFRFEGKFVAMWLSIFYNFNARNHVITSLLKKWTLKSNAIYQIMTCEKLPFTSRCHIWFVALRQPLLTPSLTYFYNPSLSWRYVVFVHRTGMTWPRDAPCKTNTSNRENAQRLQQQSCVRKVRQFLLSRKKMRIAVSASQKDFFRVNEETPH